MSNDSNNITTNTMRSLLEAANGIDEAAVGSDPMADFDRRFQALKENYGIFLDRVEKMKKAYEEGDRTSFDRYWGSVASWGRTMTHNLEDLRKIPLMYGFEGKHGKKR